MKSSEYWKKRFQQLEEASHAYGQMTYSQIEPAFDKAQKEIQKEIDAWYARFAANNNVSMQEARKMLSSRELSELKWDIDDYIKYGQQNAVDGRWMKQLENASAKFHISRLEALQLRTQQSMEKAFGNELDSVDAMARHLYTDGYYHTAFEIQKGFNIGWNIGQIDERTLDKVITKPWATDGNNFSSRIWSRKDQTINELHQELTRTIVQGKSPDEAIKHMQQFVDKKVKNAKYAAGRLVMTEDAYFHSLSQKDAFNDLDVDEFENVATLDMRTSEICQDMDGSHFPMKDYEPGITAPPFHPNCRTVTVPYFNDEWSGGERAARDEDGKTYYVSSDMTYPEWKKAFVDGGSKATLKPAASLSNRNYDTEIGKKFGKEHYDGMHDLIDSCENQKAVEVWSKNEASITVGDVNYKGHEYCSGSQIFVNGEHDRKGSNWQSPYQVSFHESSHAIDRLNADKADGLGIHFSAKYKDGLFPQTIKDEVNEMVKKKEAEFKQMFKDHKDDWEWLHEHDAISDFDYNLWKSAGHFLGNSKPKYNKRLAYRAVEKEINKLPPIARCDLSDILEGATKEKISCGFGHGKSYWSKKVIFGVEDGLATESFAEMMDSTFANSDSLAAIQKYLPKSYSVFLEMLDVLAG